MKKYIIFIAASVFVFSVSAASYAASGEVLVPQRSTQEAAVSIDKIVAKLTIYLSLTDKQAEQIKPVIEDDLSTRKELFNTNKNDKAALTSALDNLRIQTDHQLSQYLTDEQIKKFDDMQKTQASGTGSRKGGGGRKGMGRGKMF